MRLTATELRLRNALADGQPHTVTELCDVFQVDALTLAKHISNLRKKLRHLEVSVMLLAGSYRFVQLPSAPLAFVD